MLEYYPVGSEVTFGPHKKCRVQGVRILEGDVIHYEVTWWESLTRHETCAPAFEVSGTAPKEQLIGYKSR